MSQPSGLSRTAGWFDKLQYTSGLRSSRSLTLPKFLGIGAQKAGTTWMHQNLVFHPQVFLPKVEAPRTTEVHYFDLDFHHSLSSYARRFAAAGNRVPGDITPAYSIIDVRRVRFIRTVMPDVRLVLLLRNPVERAWSHAVMNLVSETRKPLDSVSDSDFITHFKSGRSRRRGNYLQIIDKWRDSFPEEQLFIGWFEDIVQAPEALLRGIFRHIRVQDDVDLKEFPMSKKFNFGGGHSLRTSLRPVLDEMYAAEIEALSARFPERAALWHSGKS